MRQASAYRTAIAYRVVRDVFDRDGKQRVSDGHARIVLNIAPSHLRAEFDSVFGNGNCIEAGNEFEIDQDAA